MWNPIDNRWDVVRPTGRSYNCDIDAREVPDRAQWGHINGTPGTEPSESKSQDEEESEEDGQEEGSSLGAVGGQIIQRAESLCIDKPEIIQIQAPDMATDQTNQTHQANEVQHDHCQGNHSSASRGADSQKVDPWPEDHREEEHPEEEHPVTPPAGRRPWFEVPAAGLAEDAFGIVGQRRQRRLISVKGTRSKRRGENGDAQDKGKA
ncbi:hypothetical protein EDB89DRAFT_1910854 [Lactarius sanguifluus]|nr:hypothetical protein EDB89DRAFT_1910854 [Lactarius sanguifluus]